MKKEINIIWLGKRLPFKYYQNIKAWAALNPGYQVNFITDDASIDLKCPGVTTLRWQDCIDKKDARQVLLQGEMEKAIDQRYYAMASNVLRFIKLYNDGGYYFDTDNVPQKPLKDMPGDLSFSGLIKPNYNLHRNVEIYGPHRFTVSALYGTKHAKEYNVAIDTMVESYQKASLLDAIAADPNPEQFDFLRSHYTASLMLSRTFRTLYADQPVEYNKVADTHDIRTLQPGVVRIEEDNSWGEGMKAVQAQSQSMAATTIQRFFAHHNKADSAQELGLEPKFSY